MTLNSPLVTPRAECGLLHRPATPADPPLTRAAASSETAQRPRLLGPSTLPSLASCGIMLGLASRMSKSIFSLASSSESVLPAFGESVEGRLRPDAPQHSRAP